MSNSINTMVDFESDDSSYNSASQSFQQGPQESKSWITFLPMLLRGIGAAAVIMSLYSFLVRGWDSSGDLTRYVFLLGHTLVLATIGFASSKLIKETKGARLLLILAVFSVPINFAVLGGFIISGIGPTQLSDIPAYVTWSVSSLQTALIVSAIAIVLLTPITLLGYKVLTRSLHRHSSLFFIGSNLLLLIPIRTPEIVSLLSLLMVGGLFYFYQKVLKNNLATKTLEGKVAYGLQFLPILILFGRSFWFYNFDVFLLSCASLTGFLAIRQLTLALDETSFLRKLLEFFSFVLAFTCGISFTIGLELVVNVSDALIIPIVAIIIASFSFELSSRGEYRASYYRVLGVVALVSGLFLNLFLIHDPLAAFVCFFAGAIMIATSFITQNKAAFIGSIVLLVAGLYYMFTHLIVLFEFNYWFGFAGLGIVSIVGGSYLDANSDRIKRWFRKSKSRFAKWQL